MRGLRDRWRSEQRGPLPVYADAATLATIRGRLGAEEPLVLREVRPGRGRRLSGVAIAVLGVPHARDVTTVAWRLRSSGATMVYASDLASLTGKLWRFARDASVLVIDGAMWRRTLFSHLTIDRELPVLCRWPVGRIVLTQIGRTAPPHDALAAEVRALCPRARPAFDGMRLAV